MNPGSAPGIFHNTSSLKSLLPPHSCPAGSHSPARRPSGVALPLYAPAFPETVEVGLRVGKLGHSSVRYELAIFKRDQDDAAATGYFVHVFVDHETRRATPIPPAIRAALQRLQAEQA